MAQTGSRTVRDTVRSAEQPDGSPDADGGITVCVMWRQHVATCKCHHGSALSEKAEACTPQRACEPKDAVPKARKRAPKSVGLGRLAALRRYDGTALA